MRITGPRLLGILIAVVVGAAITFHLVDNAVSHNAARLDRALSGLEAANRRAKTTDAELEAQASEIDALRAASATLEDQIRASGAEPAVSAQNVPRSSPTPSSPNTPPVTPTPPTAPPTPSTSVVCGLVPHFVLICP